MNILFYAYDFSPQAGGVQRVTDIISRELIQRGHNIYYLCGCMNTKTDKEKLPAPIYYFKENLHQKLSKESISQYRDLLKSKQIDIIVNQYPLNKRGDILFKETPENIKKIAFYHGMPFGMVKANRLFLKRNKTSIAKIIRLILNEKEYRHTKKRFLQILQLSDKFCFLSNQNMQVLCNELNLTSSKLYSIGNPNTFPVEDRTCIEKENIVLFVGRISDPVKNLDDFISIWEQVASKNPNWQAIIIGNDKGCDKYKHQISTKRIPRISFVGHQQEIKEFYQRAKFCCITSHSEGWPMVISESMASGCIPCAYATFGSVYELIEHDKSGIIVKPYDITGMAHAINQLIQNPKKQALMSEEAKLHIKQFSVENIASQYEALFTSLCKQIKS